MGIWCFTALSLSSSFVSSDWRKQELDVRSSRDLGSYKLHEVTNFGIMTADSFAAGFMEWHHQELTSNSGGSFARDVCCYLHEASGLFYVYLSIEIFFWQAAGFVLFYAFLVGLEFYLNLGVEPKREFIYPCFNEVLLDKVGGALEEGQRPGAPHCWERGSTLLSQGLTLDIEGTYDLLC